MEGREILSGRFLSHRLEPYENKTDARNEIEAQVAQFLKRKGKITEVPAGVTALNDYGVTLDEAGNPVSGFPGIVWNQGSHRWQVFAGKDQRRPIGFADTIADGLKLQKKFNGKVELNGG